MKTKPIAASMADRATWTARAREVIETECDSLRRSAEGLGSSFEKALELALAALARGGRLVVTGVGKNLPIAEKISATLSSTGSTSFVLNPVQALHGDLGMLSGADCLIALSFSGESEEITRLLPHVRRRAIPIIGIAGRADCTLGRKSDALLVVETPCECDPFNLAPTASTTATLALGDAFAMVLLDLRGFGSEDYARLHPAGAIGRALLTRATDIMRTGEKLAALPPTATVKDALVAMTQARAGATYVVDDAGKLLGVFTDGDLRRSLTSGDAPLSRPLAEAMTPNPIRVRSERMATDVLAVFQAHQIDDIPVVDASGRLVGGIDISDLPKLKVL